jgi:hypothetical protein
MRNNADIGSFVSVINRFNKSEQVPSSDNVSVCTREVLSADTDYPDLKFPRFSSVPAEKCCDINFIYATPTFFHSF